MKARTKLQVDVLRLSKQLLPISKAQNAWALSECLEHKGYATKHKVNCLDCGGVFVPELVIRNKAVCPQCKTKLSIEKTAIRTNKQKVYFAIAQTFGEYQVIRNYEVIANYKTGAERKVYLHEILQYWVLPSKKMEMVGKNHNSNWCMDSWSGDMEIRKEGGRSYYNNNKYKVYPYAYHPDSYFKPEYSKYGINKDLCGITFLEAITILPNNPKIETLLKAKQYSLVSEGASYRISQYWDSIKICLRNKYKIKDKILWFDYLDLLKYFKKDLRNAKYVCPADLKKEHDLLMSKKREILRIQEQEREERNIIKRQENLKKAIVKYVERFNKFFDLKFTDGALSIQLLKSIYEFKTEGDKLNHCVYTNEYYLKEDSLIFSAKIKGKHIETIELTISDMTIQQSRGINNKSTKHHDKVIKLMNKSIPKIQEVIRKSKSKKAKQQIQKSA